ncbi:HMG1/2 protein-like [Trifolium repens]|nr:HMG1/2 protein-like [Trifolium repens]
MPNAKADSKAADKSLKPKGARTGRKQTNKAAKDPNKPKRVFFVFMAEPATALGLIRAGALENATTADPGAAQSYSAAVNWKI